MATKKKSRRSNPRKRTQSYAGKILPPLDVNSTSKLEEFSKRIKKGPITIMLVYADWCGHCHEIMPHWDKATNTPNRSIQAVKVNEKLLSNVNQTVNRSINRSATPYEVQGYPSIMLVDKQGNKVSDVNPVKDSVVLSNAMKNVGPIAQETGMNQPPAGNQREPGAPLSNTRNALEMNGESEIEEEGEGEAEPVMPSLESVQGETSTRSSLYANLPPSIKNEKEMTPYNKLRGGASLYASMSQSAYTLAPAAALLGMASYVMSSRRTQKGKSKRSHRRSHRSHRRRYKNN